MYTETRLLLRFLSHAPQCIPPVADACEVRRRVVLPPPLSL